MRSPAHGLPVRRLRGSLGLLFAISFLAAGAMTIGASLLIGARTLSERIPDAAEYFVVARAGEVEQVRAQLSLLAGVRVVEERRAGEILARTGAPEIGPDHLVVFEVHVRRVAEAAADVLAATGGVVDVIDLNAEERAEFTWHRVMRRSIAGVALLGVGCAVFVAAVIACAQLAGRECRDEIGVRVLLGAEAEGLWGPLGLIVGAVALSGGLAAFSTALLLPRSDAATVPAGWVVSGLLALLVGTLGLSLGAARRAVARAARATVLASVAAWVVLGAPDGVLASRERNGVDGPVRDAEVLRALSRDLAVCRRAQHVARKGLVATEHHAVLAAANGDEVLLRIAAAKRAEDLDELDAWEERCAALEDERDRMREVLHSTRLLGPAITPRQAPVEGVVAVRYGQAGRRPGTAGFRNGVAMRTRRGESVRATAPGRVAYSGELPGSGAVVVIDHGRRTYSVYAKISRSLVRVGEEVAAGQTVARAQTGLLYFSVRRRGQAVDPLRWVADAPKS